MPRRVARLTRLCREAAQFADHGRTGPLVRTYSALVWGVPDRKTGTIDAPLDRSSTHRDRMAVVRAGKGREAVTHYEVEARFAGDAGAPVAALVACQLETGRTHQIRVHLADAGYPLVGDALYGGKALPSMSRQALHAWRLSLTHPVTGEPCVWRSDPPQDLLDTLQCVGLGYNFAQ